MLRSDPNALARILLPTEGSSGNYARVVFARGGKSCGKAQMSNERSFCQKNRGGLQKWLANLWSRKKITKKVHAGRGQQTKWETPGYYFFAECAHLPNPNFFALP
jgi:hypothetical protein